jgi:hypothetical protein
MVSEEWRISYCTFGILDQDPKQFADFWDYLKDDFASSERTILRVARDKVD